ncbi:MAG: putative polymerase alpha and epsilon subunit, partial [Bacteroidota bacterium]
MYLIFDTETTGLPKSWSAPITDTDNWPRCVQIAWQLHDEMGNLVEHQDYLIRPEGFNIPYDAEQVHGISTDLATAQGILLTEMLEKFNIALSKASYVVGQNIAFDINIMGCEFHRAGLQTPLLGKNVLDTCSETTAELLRLPGGRGGKFKLPTLTELHEYLFGQKFSEAHNATADVEATTRCFLELVKRGTFSENELLVDADYYRRFKEQNTSVIQPIGLKHINLKAASEALKQKLKEQLPEGIKLTSEERIDLTNSSFAHLHNHSQFSVLQSTISIPALINNAVKCKMPAVALTDIGNMMGAFQFVSGILAHNKTAEAKNKELEAAGEMPSEVIMKPIMGCEFFVCENRLDKTKKDNGYQVVFLAKNKNGYHNLAKLASYAYTEGMYYVPRIDKELIQKYKEDIIVLTGSLYGEVPNKILNVGENQAEEALLWWKEQFGEDLYIEIMRHNQQDEDAVNQTLIQFSQKHAIKLVATNNTFY